MRRTLNAVAVATVCAVAMGAKAETGTTYHWNPGQESTSWILPGNWDPDRDDPDRGDFLYVDKSGGSTCTYDRDTETVSWLTVRSANTLVHGAPQGQTRKLVILGDLWISTSDMYDSGTYELSPGGELEVRGGETVGWSGYGYFYQTGGTHEVWGGMVMGGGSGYGRYELSAGQLTVGHSEHSGDLKVGRAGDSRFIQTGGSVQVIAKSTGQSVGWVAAGNPPSLEGGVVCQDAALLPVQGARRDVFPHGRDT